MINSATQDDRLQILEGAKQQAPQMADLKSTYFDLRLAVADQDTQRWKRLLCARIIKLPEPIRATDLASTESQMTVFYRLDNQLEKEALSCLKIKINNASTFHGTMANAGFGDLML